MNHILLGSLLVISLNTQKCNEERSNGSATAQNSEQTVPADDTATLKIGEGDQDMEQLEGQRWYILTLEEAAMGLPEGAERPYLELENGQLQGFGGCNNLMGSYTIEENRIHFTEVGSTKKYCPELQATERSVLEMLSEVNAYAIEEDTLVLLQGTRHLAMLKTTEE